MISDAAVQKLLANWAAQVEGYTAEIRRLERLDSSRHAISISMLSASAQALERCQRDLQVLLGPIAA